MWYEILPCLAIIGAGLYIPPLINEWSKMWMFGSPHLKDLRKDYDEKMFVRDQRLVGNPHKGNGLDSLPDVPLKK